MAERAVVFGGGGLFGAFQAGVWRGMESWYAPDLVVGASAGSLNAWAVAAEMPAGELCRLWANLDRELPAPGWRVPRYLGDGVLDVSGLAALLERIVTAWPRRRDLAVTVTEMPGFRDRVYRNDEITVEHLLASCAVPGLLPARRLGGRGLAFDGGLREACPVWVAEQAGAAEIVAVDVWVHLPSWWYWGRTRPVRRPKAGVTRIEPAARLGPLRQSAVWNREAVARWLAEGEAAGRALGSARQ